MTLIVRSLTPLQSQLDRELPKKFHVAHTIAFHQKSVELFKWFENRYRMMCSETIKNVSLVVSLLTNDLLRELGWKICFILHILLIMFVLIIIYLEYYRITE